MVGRKAVSVVLSVVVFLAAIPVAGLAASVNREIASDPAKVLAEIEAMNLPDMPDELAMELRGEFFVVPLWMLQAASWLILYGEPVYNLLDAYYTTISIFYASLQRGTPVYLGTASSTPAYYKK